VRHTSTVLPDESLVTSFILETDQWVLDKMERCQEIPSKDHATSHAHPSSRPVILLEDNRDMRDYIARLLRSDYEVIQASDGLEALELALMRLLLI
jgi:hypothetical protein